ncbi:MAG: hypothetical protein Q8P67_24935 [archaeon]|nr:hypothetical protein [archaeon]
MLTPRAFSGLMALLFLSQCFPTPSASPTDLTSRDLTTCPTDVPPLSPDRWLYSGNGAVSAILAPMQWVACGTSWGYLQSPAPEGALVWEFDDDRGRMTTSTPYFIVLFFCFYL